MGVENFQIKLTVNYLVVAAFMQREICAEINY